MITFDIIFEFPTIEFLEDWPFPDARRAWEHVESSIRDYTRMKFAKPGDCVCVTMTKKYGRGSGMFERNYRVGDDGTIQRLRKSA